MNVTQDKRATRWDDHRKARRAELVTAAIVAIRERGAGVGMDEVAAQAATSKTVVYRHFVDRSGLYLAVCARVAEILLGQIGAAVATATDPRAQAAAGIDAYLRLIEHDPEVYRFVVHRPLADRASSGDDAPDPLADLVSLIGDEAAAAIATELTRVGADPAPSRTWGHAVVGLVRGAGDDWLARPADLTRAELTARLTDLAWNGLAGLVAAGARKEDSS